MSTLRRLWNQRRRAGFIIPTLAFVLLMLIGVLALCVDLGRMYIAKNELQAFSDAAALSANRELDGTDAGVARARDKATNYPVRWYFRTQAVSAPLVTFAQNREGPYVMIPPSPPTGYRYTRVEATGSLPLYFMPSFQATSRMQAPAAMLLTVGSQASISADSYVGQIKLDRFGNNLLPYSPDAHLDAGRTPVYNPGYNGPDPFNFVVGKQYTLRWPPLGQRDKPNQWCNGDKEANFVTPSPASERGFIDIGYMAGSGGSAYIRDAIVNNVQSHTLQIGDPIVNVNGNRGTESDALRERVNQDTDTQSRTFAQYMNNRGAGNQRVGNGRRIVFVPVNNPYNEDRIVEFGAFFLPVASEVCGNKNTDPCCAEYIGAGLLPGRTANTQTVGVFVSKLLE